MVTVIYGNIYLYLSCVVRKRTFGHLIKLALINAQTGLDLHLSENNEIVAIISSFAFNSFFDYVLHIFVCTTIPTFGLLMNTRTYNAGFCFDGYDYTLT